MFLRRSEVLPGGGGVRRHCVGTWWGRVCLGWAGTARRAERGGEERDGGEPVASGEKCRQEGVGGAVARWGAGRGRTKLVVARPAWVILVAKTTVSGIVDWVGRTSIPYGDLS